MDLIISSSPVWGAFITACSVIAGGLIAAVVTSKKDASETALKALTLLVEQYSVEKTEIKQRLEKVEEEVDDLSKNIRRIKEKYSVALTHIHVLRTRAEPFLDLLDQHDISHGPIPDVPKLIAADFIQAAQ